MWFLIPGLIAFGVGFITFNKNHINASDLVTTGRYVSIDTNRLHATKNSPNSKIVHYPAVIEYRDQDGQTHQLETNVPSLPLPKIGSEARIAYDKTHPEMGREASTASKLIAYLAFGVGLVLFAFGAVLISGVLERKPYDAPLV